MNQAEYSAEISRLQGQNAYTANTSEGYLKQAGRVTPLEFAEFIRIARDNKVQAFEIGDVRVTFSQLALVPALTPGQEYDKKPDKKGPVVFKGYSETELFGAG